MTPDKYQQLALRTWYDDGAIPRDEQVNQAMLQLASESGEIVKLWVKHLYKPGHTIDREVVKDEIADVFYYVCIIAHMYGHTIDDLADHLRVKLAGGHGWNGSSDKVKARIDSRELDY